MQHFVALVWTVISLRTLADAHGNGTPRLFGGGLKELNARSTSAYPPATHRKFMKRQSGNTDGFCGPGLGTCAAGYCCSEAGWCGQGTEYCASPGCQFQYGPACDDNTVPRGASTSTVARPLVGGVPYGGAGIYDCTVPGTVAITYDDGPYIYTNDVLDILASYNAKATFFITGNNNGKGEIDNAANPWAAVIQRMIREGHQVASHTWTHQALSSLTSAQRKQQMYSNEMAIRNIIGKFPTYMRPPYSDCTSASGCQADMKSLGYHITYFDLDTDDYENDSPMLIQNAKDNFDVGFKEAKSAIDDFLVIGHDIHDQTVHNLTTYMLDRILAAGFRPVAVGECLGDLQVNWYRSSSGTLTPVLSSTPLPATSTRTSSLISATAVSTDARCSGRTGKTCSGSAFGNCCSLNGWW